VQLNPVQRWATFDCYGTLIDWDGGVRAELVRVFGESQADAQSTRYHDIEPELQRDGALTYREVLTEAMRRLGAPASAEHGLADSLPAWRAFPEVTSSLEELRRRGWSLAILSNTDDDFIAASQVRIGVPFDEVVVAQEIGSYKPGHRHWEEFFSRTHAPREGHVHVAASLFHDIQPANALGLRSVWINRLDETSRDDARPDRELLDLVLLPETLDELVPA
jgi:2-haloacid dehalogenase